MTGMINRIRDIRREKHLTLAHVAERCSPPTTAQTIGRLETGTRTLSLEWLNRIAAALDVAPELLLRSESGGGGGGMAAPRIVARLAASGAEALAEAREAILPSALSEEAGELVAIVVEGGAGEYRAGDQVWLRKVGADRQARLLNRDVLAPRPGGRFAFGRLIDRDGTRVGILPAGSGQRQVVLENPAWIAVAEMLVRPL